jgi:hypothetical protein
MSNTSSRKITGLDLNVSETKILPKGINQKSVFDLETTTIDNEL